MASRKGIKEFLNTYPDFARSNRFEIEIIPPSGVDISGNGVGEYSSLVYPDSVRGQFNRTDKGKWDARRVSFACYSANFPNLDITDQIDLRTNTYYIQAFSRHTPVNLQFYESSEMNVRKFFDSWMQIMNNKNNQTSNFYSEYVGTIYLYQLNRKGERTYGVMLKEAYPTVLISNENSFLNDELVVSTIITINYKLWYGDGAPFSFFHANN